MALGFGVSDLVAAARKGASLSMGLSRVPEAAWSWPAVDSAARDAAFDAHPDSVVILPEAEDAGREVAAMRGVGGGLAEAARAGWEDLCVLQPDDDNGYRLTAGAVGFPTDWRLSEKIGRSLTGVHAPIHHYADQLATGVDHFFRTLSAGPIFGRANWFIVADDRWRYLPTDDPATRFAGVTAGNAGKTLFVRCERQTLRRLPASKAVLFTIGIAVAPLNMLSPGVVRQVADGIAAQSAGEQDRRAAPFYADALAGYAAALTDDDRRMDAAE